MSDITTSEISERFFKNPIGLIGVGILFTLILISCLTAILIPIETFKEWNNPGKWLSLPKTATPEWVNIFLENKIPEHKILFSNIQTNENNKINLISQQFVFEFNYDYFPNDFIYEFSTEYSDSPFLQIIVTRPDGIKLELLSTTLPYSEVNTNHFQRIFSTDNTIKKNILLESDLFIFDINDKSPENVIFSTTDNNNVLKGDYLFEANLFGIEKQNRILDPKLIIGG